MQTLTISLLLLTSLTGCATLDVLKPGGKVKPIEVVTKPAEKTRLDIALPEPIKTKPFKWVVVTPANSEEIFKKMEQDGEDLALFAITPDGYQSLAMTIADLRNLINTQRNIILRYKEYYEPQKQVEVKNKK